MPDRSACHGRQLASSRTCNVRVCDHGIVHLSLGALTLRLSESQLHQTAATLEAAARALDARPPVTPRGERLLC
jgi:hypothetical protein